MTDKEYEEIGRFLIGHLEKLMNGEHMGLNVVCPIMTKNGGICRVQLDMPTITDSRMYFDNGLTPKSEFLHYIWVPSSKAYVLDKFVYKEKLKS